MNCGAIALPKEIFCARTCTRCVPQSTRIFQSNCCIPSMARVIDFRQIRFVRDLNARLARLSLRSRIAGTMLALVAIAGVVLAAWAVLADERLKRNITYDLLSEELAHYEQRMRVDRGAEPLRSARLSIYRSSDFAELPRRIAILRPGDMHRVRSDGTRARCAGARWRFRSPVHHLRCHDTRTAGTDCRADHCTGRRRYRRWSRAGRLSESRAVWSNPSTRSPID